MSKQSRLQNKLRAELQNKIRQLEARLASAPNTLAKEKYTKDLNEARRSLLRLN